MNHIPGNQVLSTQIRRKSYLDSVALMRHSKILAEMAGVVEAAMMMATPANQAILFNAGLLETETLDADGGDLVISVRGTEQASVEHAMQEAAKLLDQRTHQAGTGSTWRPRSIRTAVQNLANANLTLISVPGQFAISEARKAIRAGTHAMIFSDNVPIEAEAELKQEARSLGKLIMGPDCGTSIINGVPLAFANVINRGDIGIVGASGTGIQEVTCLIDHLGKGISHAIGVGGRDLKEEVGGISTLMAIEALGRDSDTRHIVVISKPPSKSVADQILTLVGATKKDFTLCFVGANKADFSVPGNAKFTNTLKDAAESATGLTLPGMHTDIQESVSQKELPGNRIAGLYCGGTLCAEAQIILQNGGESVASNAPVPGAKTLQNGASVHQIIDLGADEYTQGKPHPMIEPSIRDEALMAAVNDKRVGVVLVDIVIGYGAHADPAGQLVSALSGLERKTIVIGSVTGTDADPQIRRNQIATLKACGVVVCASNADAATLALECVSLSAMA